jgi:hypothetical protein
MANLLDPYVFLLSLLNLLVMILIKMKKKTTTTTKKTTTKRETKNGTMPQRLEAIKKGASKIEPETIAKGAAAVSIAAGVIAAGAMMAKKENRKMAGRVIAKGAKIATEMAQEIGDEASERYQAVQMTVPLKSRSSSKSSSSSRGRRSSKT